MGSCSLREHVSLQLSKFMIPRPPSCFGMDKSCHETLVPIEIPMIPCHKKELQILLIPFITLFSIKKALLQNPMIPAITEEMRVNLPAIEREWLVQDVIFFLI
ncbi:hypothetical protein N665_0322s0021 [Sinapis alba]|nr:hypothetical protein N665_0322s0021 [Sinapis alba]